MREKKHAEMLLPRNNNTVMDLYITGMNIWNMNECTSMQINQYQPCLMLRLHSKSRRHKVMTIQEGCVKVFDYSMTLYINGNWEFQNPTNTYDDEINHGGLRWLGMATSQYH